MLKEKLQLISKLDEQILTAREVDEIMKDVEDDNFFKVRLMDAITNISTSTTPTVPKMSLPQENYMINASTLPASTLTSSDTSTLAHFNIDLQQCFKSSLGVKASQYGGLLIPIIMAKLPLEIRIHVTLNITKDVWDIEFILNVIQNEIEAREISKKVKAMTSNTESKRPQFPKNQTTGQLLDSTPPLPTPTCVYCSEDVWDIEFIQNEIEA